VTTVGWSTLEVIPSVKNLRSQLEKQTSNDFTTVGRKGGEKFGDAAGKAAGGRFKSKFGSLAKDAFAPVAGFVAGAAIVSVFKDAISGASDLAESGSKISVIFGDASDQVKDFASQGAKALGQTRLEVLNAAGTFGTFGKAAGLSGDELSDFSTKLVGLSTDMASFFNADVSTAIEAIGSGLRGEAEPLRQFGVLLDDATLRQEALKLGLIKTTKDALTPQQKVLASYQVILEQTKDAQGDFARTSGGLANQQRILNAQWSEMKTELGSKLLPVVTKVVTAFNDGVLPAIGATGGVVVDAAHAFGELPAPIKAATGALVAFRIAQAAGITTKIASGVGALSSGLDTVRLKAMLAKDEFKNLRSGSLELNGQVGKLTPGVGRLNASLGALRSGASGAGGALKRGLGGVVGLLGGPWGLALAAGTVAITHFWQQHQKAKGEVESFMATLKAETGEFTKQSRVDVAGRLFDAGVLDDAKELGIQLNLVTDAALNQGDAMQRLNTELQAIIDTGTNRNATGDQVKAAEGARDLQQALQDQNGVVQTSQRKFADLAEVSNDVADAASSSAGATSRASGALRTYSQSIAAARGEVKKLLAAEDKRRLSLLQDRRDQIALRETIRAAREEARKGKHVLEDGSKAADANMTALLDLADQWNNSTPKVQNARGAFRNLRTEMIDLADQMNGPKGTRKDARELIDTMLKVPKTAPIRFQSEGFKEAKAELEKIIALAERLRTLQGLIVATHVPTFEGQNPRSPQRPPAPTADPARPPLGGHPAERTTSDRGVTFTGPITVNADTYADIVNGIGRHSRGAMLDGVNRGG
jgi:hypothetical protein